MVEIERVARLGAVDCDRDDVLVIKLIVDRHRRRLLPLKLVLCGFTLL